MNKILDIIDQIANEKNIQVQEVEEALIQSMIRTAKKLGDFSLEYGSTIDKENKKLNLFQKVEVVKNDDIRLSGEELDEYENKISKDNFIAIDEAKELDDTLEIGDIVQYDMEFEHMGRNAASILYQELEYRLNNFVSDNLFDKYKKNIGKLITADVTSIDSMENTFVEISEVRGMMSRKNRIKGESFKVGDTIKAVVKSVHIDKQHGLIVEISRTSPKFLEALFMLEVPELKDNKLSIEASARIPGIRAKVATMSHDTNTDPIGSMVGIKGVRIDAISTELNGENIDCLEYTAIKEKFVARALSPATVEAVVITQEDVIQDDGYKKRIYKAKVTIKQDEKSKAIGKAGVNIRLAGMLTKCDIELETIEQGEYTQDENNKTGVDELEALFK
ncbi:MAG: transcription termination/antitermination protein NusA [Campylobacteraceae bacterium 4484_166]|nr:MAG: transcription termination/antitermination protein NusA [Campylobacteraceae bacterium 4484_166]